jgi:ferric-dicitrate binding protein FerR (iron transport regulator)
MTPDDLDLLNAYLEGSLDPAAERALETRLKSEPDLARELVRLSRQELILREWTQAMQLADPGPEPTSPQPEPASSPAPARASRSWLPWGLGILAASLLVGLAVGLSIRLGNGTNVLARLQDVSGQVEVLRPDGERITVDSAHDLVGTSTLRIGGEGSRARVQYPDGSQLELSAGTTVRLEPEGGKAGTVGKQVILLEGYVHANVRPQPMNRPLVMTTPHALIKVPGTRFSSATQPEATRVELEEGRLQVVRTSDGKSIDVTEGLYAIIQPDEPALTSEPLPPRVRDHRDLITHGGGPILAIAFAPQRNLLAIGGADGTLLLWDADTRQTFRQWKAHTAKIKDLAWLPDGKTILTLGQDKADRQMKLWDARTGELKPVILRLKREADCFALSPDGKKVAIALNQGKSAPGNEQIRLHDLATGQEIGKLVGHGQPLGNILFLPDGDTLATAGRDGFIKLWSIETQTELHTFRGHLGALNALAVDPDGRTLASGGRDGVIKLWDIASHSEIRTLPGHPREVRCLAFNPDGRILASCGTDGAARLWDMRTGQELMHLLGLTFAAPAVAFSPDGVFLAASSWDPVVKVWEVPARLRPRRVGF